MELIRGRLGRSGLVISAAIAGAILAGMLVLSAATLVAFAAPASAKLTDAEVARLGADLTPMGAEKAGNKDGTIPAWTGGLCAPPSGWITTPGIPAAAWATMPSAGCSAGRVGDAGR